MKFSLSQEHNRQDVVAHEFYKHLNLYDLTRHEDTAVMTHAYLRTGGSAFMMMALDAFLADFDYLISIGKVIPPKLEQTREYCLALRMCLTQLAKVDVTSEGPLSLVQTPLEQRESEVVRLAESE